MMKIISMYLPQYHRIKENDEWWGDGYTDWTAVKNAKSLFDGHNQPRIPLDGNYYDLLHEETFKWQVELMDKYAIYGQCFYHYWFKNGKRILEKPAENLLKWKDINLHFCFCWANEPWIRSWSAVLEGNPWAPVYDLSEGGTDSLGILLEQDYGDEKDWEEHFNYLLDFFLDERYIKIDGKPVLMIYRPNSIPCLSDMVDYLNDCAKKNGMQGLYIIGANTSDKRNMDATYMHCTGSMFPSSFYDVNEGVKTLGYKKLWEYIIERAKSGNSTEYIGGLVDFDTTPRKGKNGVVLVDFDIDLYKKGLSQLLSCNEKNGLPYTFLNAWNEWGEGMYMEPDETNGYAILEATREALYSYRNIKFADNKNAYSSRFYEEKMNEYKRYWRLMERWLSRKEQKKGLDAALIKRGYKNIAVYGIGILGKHLTADIVNSDIKIEAFIDARKKGHFEGIKIVEPDENIPNVDAIIISVINEYDEIKKVIARYYRGPVVSLEEIVFDED